MAANFPLRLSESVRKAAERAAERDGVSLNQFINLAVAEKTAALDGADMVAFRASRANRTAFDAVMKRVGHEPPQEADEA